MTLKPLAKNARYPGVRPLSASMRLTVRMTSSASPESRLPRLAPPSRSSPAPVAWRRSISAQSAGRRAGDQPAGLLLHPPERRDVLVRPEQDPGLAGSRLGGEVGLPLGELVVALGDPARHGRRASVPHRAAQHRQREPVDLQEDDPGDVGGGRRSLAARHPLDDAERVLVVVVGARHDLERERDRGDHQRREQRAAERVDADRLGQRSWATSNAAASTTRTQDEPRGERERQPKRRHQWRQDRVEDRDRRRHEQRAAELLQPDARARPRRPRRRRPRPRSRRRPASSDAGAAWMAASRAARSP